MKSLLVLGTSVLLSACASIPAVDTAALVAPPAQYKAGTAHWMPAGSAEAEPRGDWWTAFEDPALDALVSRAITENTQAQVAAARVAQARALVRATNSERLPQLGIGAGAARIAEAGAGGAALNAFSAGLGLSYEADLFGRVALATRAAREDAEAAEALRQSTLLLVQADVAQAYLALRALDGELQLVGESLEAYRSTLRLTERREAAGDVAELDVARIATEVAATESEALALKRERAVLENMLAVLVGAVASEFEVAPRTEEAALPVIPRGVPSTLLTRRPDVAAAQQALLAAQTRVGVAKAAWFPTISLTASGGYASTDIGDLFNWPARAWDIGAAIAAPLFDGGRRKAGVELARAELDEAVALYRKQVLDAFRDVESQLVSLQLLQQQSEAQQRAVGTAMHATALSDTRYRNGYVSQLELLDAQRSELRNRRTAVQVRGAQYQATVQLIRALGGDWSPAQAPPLVSVGTTAE